MESEAMATCAVCWDSDGSELSGSSLDRLTFAAETDSYLIFQEPNPGSTAIQLLTQLL